MKMKPGCFVYNPAENHRCVLVEQRRTDDIRKLSEGDWLLGKRIDVIMDRTHTDRWSYNED